MPLIECIPFIFIAAAAGAVAGYLGARFQDRFRLTGVQAKVVEITDQARKDADNIRKEAELKAKDELFQKREEFTREVEKARGELREQERRLEKREDSIEQKHQLQLKKERTLEHTQRKLHERKDQVEKRAQHLEGLITEQTSKLNEISGLNREQAEKMLLERLEKELADEVAGRIQKHEEGLRANCEEKSRQILATAIQRYAAEHTADTTVSTVDIPSDDMKGRIIGREGRNIRTFEKCTGVDVIVDDTPGVVVVSAFDNIRRETAKLALTKLIQDGESIPRASRKSSRRRSRRWRNTSSMSASRR
jgi:ribonuclease Y